MRRICICDDTIEELEHIEKLVKKFATEHPEYPFTLRKFQSAYDLLDCMEAIGGFDLFILDIIMPDLDGITLGKKIRGRNGPCEIIYLTSSREYGVEAFGVNAFHYLMKPIQKEELNETVMRAMDKLALTESPILMLKTKNGIQRIRSHDILFAESFNHYRLVHLISGECIRTARTITSLFEELGELQCFQSPHRAYIVNLDYVNGIETKELLMTGNSRIPISRNAYPKFKKAYFDYVL